MSKRVYTDACATVWFSGETLDPLDVTIALCLPPDHTHRKGELVFRRVRSGAVQLARDPYPDGMWWMTSKGPVNSPRLSVHIDWLLSDLEPKADAIHALLSTGVTGDIYCFSYGTSHRPPAVPRSLRARAQAPGLPIGIEHHEENP